MELSEGIKDGIRTQFFDALRVRPIPDAAQQVLTFARALSLDEVEVEKYVQELVQAVENTYGGEFDGFDLGTDGANDAWFPGIQPGSRYWAALVEQLQQEGRTSAEIKDIAAASTAIMSRTPRPFARHSGRGLVIGYVQSGKTTNFMAVAAHAADNGYRLVVILSGVTNNLRSQTQVRMDQSLISGFEAGWHKLTSRDEDFNATQNAAERLSSKGSVNIMVIKKNSSRLKKLIRWLESAGPAVLGECRVLVIDDECDQASLNSRPRGVREALKAIVDRRSAINKLMVKLVDPRLLPLTTYIGYSATPFANMITDAKHPDGLYPRDFIYSLKKAPGYFGPEQLFGRDPIDDDDLEVDGLDIIRTMSKEQAETEAIQLGAAAGRDGQGEPATNLRTAIAWFLLATAARRARAGRSEWSSMLVNTSARIAAHVAMAAHVQLVLDEMRSADRSALWLEVQGLWRAETVRLPSILDGVDSGSGLDLFETEFHEAVRLAKVIIDNSKSTDRLDYRRDASGAPVDAEVPVIVVGGATLSRGLTLEGLVCSYFLREGRQYDTLLQMGRWFGYRPGYEDLQRIWMPQSTSDYFKVLATVEEEIRRQVDEYKLNGLRPDQLGIRIRQHPALNVANPNVIGDAISYRGYAESRQETNLVNLESGVIARNKDLLAKFIARVADDHGFLPSPANPNRGQVAFQVPWTAVQDFLLNYEYVDGAKLNARDLEHYVGRASKLKVPELTAWNVALVGKSGNGESDEVAPGRPLALTVRSRLNDGQTARANIHHVADKIDIWLDLPASATKHVPGDPSAVRPLDTASEDLKYKYKSKVTDDLAGPLALTPLLCIYLIDKTSAPADHYVRNLKEGAFPRRVALNAPDHLAAFTIFFPPTTMPADEFDYLTPDLPDQPYSFDSDDDLVDELATLESAEQADSEVVN